MKTKSLILGVSAAGALLSTPAVMAQSAVSLPVGYASTTLSSKFNFVSPNFAEPIAFQGSVASDLAGTFTAGQFDAGAVHPTHYIEIVSGASEGARADIVSNTAAALVVEGGATFSDLLGSGSDVAIRPHVTIAGAFGSDVADLIIDAGPGSGSADTVLFYRGAGFETIFFAEAGLGTTGGWASSDAANTDAANTPIDPGAGVVVVDNNEDEDVLTFVGHVKASKTLIALEPGFNLIGLPVAVDANVTDVFGADESLLQISAGAGAGSADTILRFNGTGFDPAVFFAEAGLGTPAAWTATPDIGGSESFFVEVRTGNPVVSVDQYNEAL